MIDLRSISSGKEDLDSYEVEHHFQSWSYQPAQSPMRVVSAKGVRFTTEDEIDEGIGILDQALEAADIYTET